MKRLTQNKYIIEITMQIDSADDVLVAGYMQQLNSINNKFQVSDEILQKMDDIIDSILANIKHHNFIINNHYQSNKGYSYYINFTPIDKDKNRFSDVDIIFRIATHRQKHGEEQSGRFYIRSFIVNEQTVVGITTLLDKINKIFDKLATGDMEAIYD